MKLRYKVSLLIISLMLVGCLYVTQSYALWIINAEQTNENEMEVGCFSIGFSEQSESIKLDNTYPVNDTLGLSTNPYTFTITNTCTINNNYVLTLNTLSTNTLDASKIKYALYKSSEEKPNVGSKLSRINNDLENIMVENLGTSYILDNGVLSGGTKVDGVVSGGEEVTYNLYLWIDEIAGNEVEGQSFEASINVINSAMDSSKMPAEEYVKRISTVENGDGLYKVSHNDLEELGQEWNKTEYRYAGSNPNNYVRFNNEIWRIIGLVNAKTDGGVEQRLKIVRTDGIEGQKDFGSYAWDKITAYSNNWTTSQLKNMLNGIYYESGTGECYSGPSGSIASENTCDFNSGTDLPKGLDETARNMIDKEVIWNTGGINTYNATTKYMYEKERGTSTYSNYPAEWSNATEVSGKHNGIALLYPSDYGYAVGGNVRNNCITKILKYYNEDDCNNNVWLMPRNSLWTLSSWFSYYDFALIINLSETLSDTRVFNSQQVWPTLYLQSSVKILENPQPDLEYGSLDNPFVLEA